MVWPFAEDECWQIGPTHGKDTTNGYKASALDLAPDMFLRKYYTFNLCIRITVLA